MVCTVETTGPDLEVLFSYIRSDASFYVYNSRESRYIAGNNAESVLIINRPGDLKQPEKYWKRSQSFISRIAEIE